MDERTLSVVQSVQRFMDEVVQEVRAQTDRPDAPTVSSVVEKHLGQDPAELPIVRLDVDAHQFVNLDVAVAAIVEEHGGGSVIGVGGGDMRHHQTFGDFLQQTGPWNRFRVGAVDRERVETGPSSHRDAVAFGIHLFRYRGQPVAVQQRRANMQFGGRSGLEVVAPEELAGPLLADVRRLMVERSVFRGQLLSFGQAEQAFGPTVAGISFLERPTMTAADVVLPAGALERIERHVVSTARHRERLRAAGRHLKRGLLLYGPPGTGKTHTVRYLVSQLPEVTAIVLAGNALGYVGAATEFAHALEPSVVIVEDVDLIAEHREMHMGPQPLLFTLLDAIDGLTSEADVAFVLTTNRVDLLEAALTQRPGRVDLAVEIPRPDAEARRRLVDLYSAGLPLSAEALARAAVRTEGATASLFKELFRRVVLVAAERDAEVSDEVLDDVVDELLADAERLTRSLLGSGSDEPIDEAVVPMPFGPVPPVAGIFRGPAMYRP
ncbi:MAG TPA: ATP-binding protein [Kineosporiaceae bacterium]|nr:ATP-binding protein [Kineosporiaceae bacterium]